jgi:hypothetical protein
VILRVAVRIDAVVQVRGAPARVPGVADVADDIAGCDTITLAKGSVPIQVGVVVPLESWPQNRHRLTIESIGALFPVVDR